MGGGGVETETLRIYWGGGVETEIPSGVVG